MSEVIGLYGLIAGGTQDALASIDIPQDGFIIGVDWDMHADLDADSEFANAELSFIATNQLSTSDVRGRISSVSALVTVLSAVGGHTAGAQKWLGSFDMPVSGGERIYLHSVASSGVGGVIRANLYVDLGTVTRRSARRR